MYTSDASRISPTIIHENTDGVCPAQNIIEAQLNITRQRVKQIIACSGTGWTKIASVNMDNHRERCPSGLQAIYSPVRGCKKVTQSGGCDSTVFSVSRNYNKVCGRIPSLSILFN